MLRSLSCAVLLALAPLALSSLSAAMLVRGVMLMMTVLLLLKILTR